MNKLKQFYTDIVRTDRIALSSEDEVLKEMIREAVNKLFNTDNSPVIGTTSSKRGRVFDLRIRICIREEFIDSLVEHIYNAAKEQDCLYAETTMWNQILNFERVNF